MVLFITNRDKSDYLNQEIRLVHATRHGCFIVLQLDYCTILQKSILPKKSGLNKSQFNLITLTEIISIIGGVRCQALEVPTLLE